MFAAGHCQALNYVRKQWVCQPCSTAARHQGPNLTAICADVQSHVLLTCDDAHAYDQSAAVAHPCCCDGVGAVVDHEGACNQGQAGLNQEALGSNCIGRQFQRAHHSLQDTTTTQSRSQTGGVSVQQWKRHVESQFTAAKHVLMAAAA